jgi:ribonucleoside-triphosphate reductase
MMNISKENLEIKKPLLNKLTTSNLESYTTFYLIDIRARFGNFWKIIF